MGSVSVSSCRCCVLCSSCGSFQWCVMFGTLVGVSVFNVMWSELLMTSANSCLLWSSAYECQRVECAFISNGEE